ncbi:MAG: hypothetical protein ACI9WU_003017 [Myxococcota bacterium]
MSLAPASTERAATPPAIQWGAVAALGIAFGLLVVERYTAVQIFDGEDAHMFARVQAWLSGGEMPFRTGPIGPLPFHHGPMYYWVLAPIMAISPDPAWVRAVYVGLQIGAATLIFALLRQATTWPIALLAAASLLFSRFYFEVSRQLWHASLLPVFIAGSLFFSARLLADARRRDGLAAAACAAIALQLHVTALPYAAVAGLAALWRRKDLGVRGVLTIGLAGVLVALPIQIGAVQVLLEGRPLPPEATMIGGSSGLGPLEVVQYLAAHLGPAFDGWLSGALNLVIPLLVLCGLIAAAVERKPLAVLMAVAVGIGLVFELRLLAHDDAPRYLNPNIYPCFVLMALGLDWLRRIAPAGGALVGPLVLAVSGLLALDALLAPVPPTDWPAMTAGDQRAVARAVGPALPGLEAAQGRVHGTYLTDQPRLVGVGYFHQLFGGLDSEAEVPAGAHVLVSDAAVTPYGQVLSTEAVAGTDHTYQVVVFRPHLDWSRAVVEGPAGAQILERWTIENDNLQEPATHTIEVPTSAGGRLHVLVRSMNDVECPLVVALDERRIPAQDGPALGGGQLRTLAFNLPGPGLVRLVLGPCMSPPRLDLF